MNQTATMLAAWSRFRPLRRWMLRRTMRQAPLFSPPESAVRILFGGDINFDPTIRMMWHLGLYTRKTKEPDRRLAARVKRKLWRRLVEPMLARKFYEPDDHGYFPEYSIRRPQRPDEIKPDAFVQRSKAVDLDWASVASDFDFPFRKIAPFLRSQDLVIVNLETPLTDHPRDNGLFKSAPGYASAMKAAGISLVNLSNNHIFDGGEKGFFDTLNYLQRVDLQPLGVGDDFDSARAGTTADLKGMRFCFLSYTQFCNTRFASLAKNYAGLLPLDRQLMIEDIQAAREKADWVIVSLHWGLENQPNVHPGEIEIAHCLIDAGADCIIGHHPHVPHAIEIYRGKPILFSLGNFIFAQRNHPSWSHNFLAELIIDQNCVCGVAIHPIAGEGSSLFQPELLKGRMGDEFLEDLQLKSALFGTRITIKDGTGYIGISDRDNVIARNRTIRKDEVPNTQDNSRYMASAAMGQFRDL
jgi:poly-gamma-glutamate synthesis protein (capsule biosynthesis protein)